MRKINDLKLYPRETDQIRIPVDEEKSYSLIIFPENIDFINIYNRMGINRRYVRSINPISSNIPKTKMTGDILSHYRKLGLKPSDVDEKNSFVDLSIYLDAIDRKYEPENYRSNKIIHQFFEQLKKVHSLHSKKERVLTYVVDISAKFPDPILKYSSIL